MKEIDTRGQEKRGMVSSDINENNSSSKRLFELCDKSQPDRPISSPSNETVYMNASRFVREQNIFDDCRNERISDSSDTSYESMEGNSNVSSRNEPKSINGINDLVSELQKLSSEGSKSSRKATSDWEEPSTSHQDDRSSNRRRQLGKAFTTEAIKHCMDEQFDRARKEEITDD